ncbi:MAG: peptidase S45, penicillin amidase [uncultured Nocardioidaceae bacterium]|uniref:Peptidase S45, penicillin amidase n=1 Tax=uncultured Nocardioidaceae bacterium TaxID=253824 RepID=A0A6J4NGL9_9ACTN|nr:MAG: peptidase S45, penicillin amidase [uncultured Nocardioidaceae bacterium]
MNPRRTLVAIATTTIVPLTLVVQAGQTGVAGAAERAPSQDKYRATITRTEHGIPHVTADDWGSLGFGHGYATAETNLCNLADTVVTGRGDRSLWFGPDARYEDRVTLSATNLETDTLFTNLRDRKVVEELLADPQRGPSKRAKTMVRGYVAGANEYIRDIGGAQGVEDPTCKGAGYIKPNVTAKDLWYGVYAANLLASTGVFVPQVADAAPPTPGDPGTPEVRQSAPFAKPPAVLPSEQELLKGLGKDPDSPFGSNATAVGEKATSTGRGMVLGNPHFPWRGRYRFGQVQLTIPGKYDVAGAALLGSPVVNIGWNKDVAWSHTVSTAYRFTPYEYRYTQTVPGGPIVYATDSGPQELQRDVVQIDVKGADGQVSTVEEDVYRTPEGYVIDAPELLMGWSPASFFALRDANAEHLRTIDTFLDMGAAKNVKDLIKRQDEAGGMPWVNTTAADRSGDVVYADHSVVPHVTNDMAQQCMTPVGRILFRLAGLPGLDGTRARSDCEWGTDEDASRPGIFGPKNLPIAYRKDWVANANDSYWLPNPNERLEGFARIIGCEECQRTLRTRMVYRYVTDRRAGKDGLANGRKVTPRTLRLFQHTNRVFAAELARKNGDLQKVCEAAEGGEACEVLAEWDGMSNVDSVGAHVFQEFWERVPADDKTWEVQFDPQKPLTTPRNLNEGDAEVEQAMRDALAFLQEEGIPFDARWGKVQVAGDEGAPPIPLGGGDAGPGNANVLTSRAPAANEDRLYPIGYGSSHIQAVAFNKRGKVVPRTILTYSQSTDPTSPFSADQTRLFSKEKWVKFPFTGAAIGRATINRQVVSGG